MRREKRAQGWGLVRGRCLALGRASAHPLDPEIKVLISIFLRSVFGEQDQELDPEIKLHPLDPEIKVSTLIFLRPVSGEHDHDLDPEIKLLTMLFLRPLSQCAERNERRAGAS